MALQLNDLALLLFLTINVVFQIKVLGKCPVAKLLEKNHSSLIGIDGVKLCLHVLELLAGPLLDESMDVVGAKLLLGDPVVPLHVDGVEALVELKRGPQGRTCSLQET